MASYTNKIRYTGSSGVDVQSMVEQLMNAEAAKKNKIYKSKTSLEWQQTALRSIGNNVKTFQNNFLSFSSSSSLVNMRSSSAYSTNAATIKMNNGDGTYSSSTGITAKPAYNTSTGKREVIVTSTAQGEKRVGSEVPKVINGTEAIAYDELHEGDNFNISFNGTNLNIALSKDDVTTIQGGANNSDKAKAMQKIVQDKLDSKFGKYNGNSKVEFTIGSDDKVSIKSADGVGGTIKFSGFSNTKNSTTLLTAGELAVDADGKFTSEQTFQFKVGDLTTTISTFDTDPDTGEKTFLTRDQLLGKLNEQLKTIADSEKDTVADGDDDDYAYLASIDKDGNLKLTSDYHVASKDVAVSKLDTTSGEFKDVRKTTLAGSVHQDILGIPSYDNSTALNKSQTLEQFGLSNYKFTVNGKEFNMSKSTTIDQAMKQINSSGAGLKMEYDTTTSKFSISSTSTGSTSTINFGDGAKDFFGKFGIDTEKVIDPAATDGSKAASDAVVSINGVQSVFTTNSFNFDNIDYNISGATAGTTFEVEIGATSNSAFDNIKNFVNEYNKMIDELQTATTESRKKAGSYSYYEPLTEDEKTGMSEDEIEKYEKAAKQGILRGDDSLTKLTNKLRQAMNTPVTLADGSKMYLYELGISTGDYTKGAKLEIDEKKLKSALEERPGDVATLFTNVGTTKDGKTTNKGLMELVNDTITEAVGTNGYLSKYAGFENTVLTSENVLSKKIAKYDSELADLEKYLYNKENYYYKMFSAMEQSINQSNSDMSYLASFMG